MKGEKMPPKIYACRKSLVQGLELVEKTQSKGQSLADLKVYGVWRVLMNIASEFLSVIRW